MNDPTLPPEPPSEPPPPLPAKPAYSSEAPSKKMCTLLGFLIFVVSGGLAFVFPPICILGFIAAVTSLFFQGYRCIFVGYILTLGVILLAAIIYCSIYPLRID